MSAHICCIDISSIEAINVACFDRNYTYEVNAPDHL
jgi:hypothetical protein